MTNLQRERLARGLNASALLVAAMGLMAALALFVARAPDDARDASGQNLDGVYASTIVDDRREQYEIERLGGKMGVLMVEFNEWLASLWQGQRLAYSIAIMTLGLAGVLRFAAVEVGHSGEA